MVGVQILVSGKTGQVGWELQVPSHSGKPGYKFEAALPFYSTTPSKFVEIPAICNV